VTMPGPPVLRSRTMAMSRMSRMCVFLMMDSTFVSRVPRMPRTLVLSMFAVL
jgi:hypothetical protein